MILPRCLALIFIAVGQSGASTPSKSEGFTLVSLKANASWSCQVLPGPSRSRIELRLLGLPRSPVELRSDCGGAAAGSRVVIMDRNETGPFESLPYHPLSTAQVDIRMVQRIRGVRALVELRSYEEPRPALVTLRDLGLTDFRQRGYSNLSNLDVTLDWQATEAAGSPPPEDQVRYEERILPLIGVLPVLHVDADPLPGGFRLKQDRLVWGKGRFELRQWEELSEDRPLRGYLFVDRTRRQLLHWATRGGLEDSRCLIRMTTQNSRVHYENLVLSTAGISVASP